MDEQTVQTYSEHHAEFGAKYDSACGGISDYFATAFPPGSTVLDIGCGSGRDLRILHEMGYSADGVDPCPEFVESARRCLNSYGSKVWKDSLPALESVEDKGYSAALCSAVLMHLPEEELFDAAFSIRRILCEKGRLLLSVPLPEPLVALDTHRRGDGRLFSGVSPNQIELLFERIGFRLISRWDSDDALGRSDRKWASLLFELESSSGSRPIDTIESVLNKDAKVATYKLALFRSLAEIAVTNYKLADWTHDGKIKVPVSALADKWVEYYWPIIESKKQIPQTTGRPIAFRKPLEELVRYYRSRGGLSAFSLEYRNAELSAESHRLHRALFSKLKQTIWNQPVRYAGGGEDFSVFGYDRGDKTVLVGCDIWKELSLMGTWIQDATILRWAELTAKISNDRIRPSDVIDCLLTVPVTQREVHAAKKFYDSLKDKRCVWSDQSISQKYDLDHAIPFSLWKNNDLWNLLPANSQVNGQKKDRLPAQELVKRRRDCIIGYWEQIHQEYPARFRYEAEKFVGTGNFDSSNWEKRLFSTFTEAIEITAIQRGVDRWDLPSTASSTVLQERATLSLVVHDEVDESEQYFHYVPFYSLKAAAGYFNNRQEVESEGWVEVDTPLKLLFGMFVAKVEGSSMEPRIPSGSYCLFQTLENMGVGDEDIVLIQHHTDQDPEQGGSYAVKRIVHDSAGRARFRSINPEFAEFSADEACSVVALFLEVLNH